MINAPLLLMAPYCYRFLFWYCLFPKFAKYCAKICVLVMCCPRASIPSVRHDLALSLPRWCSLFHRFPCRCCCSTPSVESSNPVLYAVYEIWDLFERPRRCFVGNTTAVVAIVRASHPHHGYLYFMFEGKFLNSPIILQVLQGRFQTSCCGWPGPAMMSRQQNE